jgi:tripartite-type tricarboxylate transporter receptor subunit TctC
MPYRIVHVIALAASLGLATMAAAQPYPAKPVRIIVPVAAGGGLDFVTRLLGHRLTEALGQQMIVENRAGGGSTIGTDFALRAAPDGYTLLTISPSYSINPSLYPLKLDPLADFTPVILLSRNPYVIAVHPSLPARTTKELIALAKARPDDLNFATGGQGSSPHMSVELLKSMTGIRMTAIHYKGDGAAISDLLGGQVPIMFASIAGLLPHTKTGKLRGIAVTGAKRSSIAPEFPTIAESGLKGYEVVTWFGILTTAGTPAEVVSRLNNELVQMVTVPSVKEKITGLGLEIVGNSSAEYAAFLKEENVKWGNMVKSLGLKAE